MQRLPLKPFRPWTQIRRLTTPTTPPSPPNTTRYAGHPGSPEPPLTSSATSSSTSSSSTPSPNSIPNSSTPPRLPSRLERYAPRLKALSTRTGVPLPSLAISFLVLHELTAVVPVVGFYYLFSALGAGAGFVTWLASLSDDEGDGKHSEAGASSGWKGVVAGWYDEGGRRVEKVGRKYGVLGYEKGSDSSAAGGATAAVADAVAAYVVVKALLPLRIGFSLAAAPAFARGIMRPFQRWRGK